MYSAIEAEVKIPSDPSTHRDDKLIAQLKSADTVSHFMSVLIFQIVQFYSTIY